MNDLINILRTEIRKIVKEELDARDAATEAELKQVVEPRRGMKEGKYSSYKKLRNSFNSFRELGNVINVSRVSVSKRMNGKIPFSENEKTLILNYLDVENTPENRKKYFNIGRKEKAA